MYLTCHCIPMAVYELDAPVSESVHCKIAFCTFFLKLSIIVSNTKLKRIKINFSSRNVWKKRNMVDQMLLLLLLLVLEQDMDL